MANTLLDFVMALVRDPDAAAQYEANPAQAIADANLTDVSSADVDNLIPVVSESLSTSMPGGAFDAPLDSNVWSSGAATEAFDAFAAPAIDQSADDAFAIVTDLVPQTASAIDVPDDTAVAALLPDDLSVQAPAPEAVDFGVETVVETAHQSGLPELDTIEPHLPSSLDLFD